MLLADSKLVALFGQRTGKLPDNSLQSAIADVASKPDLLWSDVQVVALQNSLNAAVKALAPVTLLDLRNGWNPFERSKLRMVTSAIKNALFLLFAGTLIIAAAASTFVLNHGTGIVLALEALKEQEPQRRIGQLQRQLLNAQPTAAAATSAEIILAREAYFSTLDDLREIDQRLSIYMPLSQSFPSQYGNPLVMASNLFWRRVPSPNVPPIQAPPPQNTPSQAPVSQSGSKASNVSTTIPLSGTPGPGPNSETRPVQTSDQWGQYGSNSYASMNISCELAKASGQFPDNAFARTEIGKMFIQYQTDALNLFCYQRLLYQPSMIPPIEARLGEMNVAVGIYALWILPAIYGALGATIFFMRSVLDRLIPDPPFGRIALRIALGALAGIVLGWFWSPENALSSDIAKVGFSLFATAFIVGFSIDVFFAMMDRFVKVTEGFFTGDSTPQPPNANQPIG